MFAKFMDKHLPARKALYRMGVEDAALNWDEMEQRLQAVQNGGVHLASVSIFERALPAHKGDVLLRSHHASYVRGFLDGCAHMNERAGMRFQYLKIRQPVERVGPGNYVIARLA